MKFLNAYFFWNFTPLPLIIFVNNAFWWQWDTIKFWRDPLFAKMKPDMYDNWFARLFMSNRPLTIFKWYDVFTTAGYVNWMVDGYLVAQAPWLQLVLVLLRQLRNDWSYTRVENDDLVDRNRFWRRTQWVDPYDYNYWSSRDEGRDCNGNVGPGNYCYCPSQGYNCQCQPNDWYAQG